VRVLLASPATGEYGGMEEFVIALAQQLSARGDLEVRACFKLLAGASASDTLRAQVKRSGISCALVPRVSVDLLVQLKWADVVHAQAPSPDICALARMLGKKLVLTVHNHLHGQRGARVLSWRAALRLAQRRWYNSHFVRGSWERSAPSAGSEAFPAVARVDRQFAPLEGRKGFVFVSRMVPGKGAETLLEAYRAVQLDPALWPLRLVGEGPLLADLQTRFASQPGVHFEGFVAQPRKEELIAHSRWLVAVPNYLEAMGITPIEARRKGVPCIVSLDGGLPEVAGSEALTCAPGDPVGLARCLVAAARLSDEDYAARASAAYEGVAGLLRPLEWYADSYYAVLGRQKGTMAAPRVT
jgi:glycosyltransferase involved in cell wall biosynthesis